MLSDLFSLAKNKSRMITFYNDDINIIEVVFILKDSKQKSCPASLVFQKDFFKQIQLKLPLEFIEQYKTKVGHKFIQTI